MIPKTSLTWNMKCMDFKVFPLSLLQYSLILDGSGENRNGIHKSWECCKLLIRLKFIPAIVDSEWADNSLKWIHAVWRGYAYEQPWHMRPYGAYILMILTQTSHLRMAGGAVYRSLCSCYDVAQPQPDALSLTLLGMASIEMSNRF